MPLCLSLFSQLYIHSCLCAVVPLCLRPMGDNTEVLWCIHGQQFLARVMVSIKRGKRKAQAQYGLLTKMGNRHCVSLTIFISTYPSFLYPFFLASCFLALIDGHNHTIATWAIFSQPLGRKEHRLAGRTDSRVNSVLEHFFG